MRTEEACCCQELFPTEENSPSDLKPGMTWEDSLFLFPLFPFFGKPFVRTEIMLLLTLEDSESQRNGLKQFHSEKDFTARVRQNVKQYIRCNLRQNKHHEMTFHSGQTLKFLMSVGAI